LGTGNINPSAAAGALTVRAAPSKIFVLGPRVSFDGTADVPVVVSASVTTPAGRPVQQGIVAFTFGTQSVSAVLDERGIATVTLIVSAGTPVGSYRFTALYVDTANAKGVANFRSSTESAYIKVSPPPVSPHLARSSLAPDAEEALAAFPEKGGDTLG
jgi:hypothetical protein